MIRDVSESELIWFSLRMMIMIDLESSADEHCIAVLINNESDLNLISQNQVKEYSLNSAKALNHNLVAVDSQKLFDYEMHHLKMKTSDQDDQI